ncbi:MAG: 1-acyl-sn-glycerol-3-phosphate acyltransferase [Bacteroidia bacterium]|nr:1-acyl-sn-glycerol-3-phosphate acyltransferase [Bacteroidia bacterium]NNC85687.1 1-acyl-sn-glycerol-3-phosphate acyltransferase [Bacteroidia bacterium]NNM16117.1 1-acyl-sn-glycerol-3-phosphate acyltransferase [Bacteroidia bacterium]
MKQVFLFIYRIYCAIAFGLIGLLAFVFYFLVINLSSKKNLSRNAHRVSQYWARTAMAFIFVKMKISNKNFIDPKRTYVFVANHQSLLDVPCWTMACQNTLKFLSKEEMMKLPVFGYVLKRIYVAVKRDSPEDRKRSMERMASTLRNGVSLFIAPEGRRNKTDKPLLPFHNGAFRLAIMSQTPIAVITVLNSGEFLKPKEPFKLYPGTVKATWSEPIETKGLTEENMEELKSKVRNIMLNKLSEYDKKV